MRSSNKLYEGQKEDKVKLFMKLTGMDDPDYAYEILDEYDWDLDNAISAKMKGKKKKSKDKKIFKVGDIVKCIDNHAGKNMPPDVIDFLLTYKKFKVRDVNDKLNIDIGHKLAENGNPYYYSPNRFELLDGIAPVKKAEPEPEKKVEPAPPEMPFPKAGKAGKAGVGKAKADEEIVKKKMAEWQKIVGDPYKSAYGEPSEKWDD